MSLLVSCILSMNAGEFSSYISMAPCLIFLDKCRCISILHSHHSISFFVTAYCLAFFAWMPCFSIFHPHLFLCHWILSCILCMNTGIYLHLALASLHLFLCRSWSLFILCMNANISSSYIYIASSLSLSQLISCILCMNADESPSCISIALSLSLVFMAGISLSCIVVTPSLSLLLFHSCILCMNVDVSPSCIRITPSLSLSLLMSCVLHEYLYLAFFTWPLVYLHFASASLPSLHHYPLLDRSSIWPSLHFLQSFVYPVLTANLYIIPYIISIAWLQLISCILCIYCILIITSSGYGTISTYRM